MFQACCPLPFNFVVSKIMETMQFPNSYQFAEAKIIPRTISNILKERQCEQKSSKMFYLASKVPLTHPLFSFICSAHCADIINTFDTSPAIYLVSGLFPGSGSTHEEAIL